MVAMSDVMGDVQRAIGASERLVELLSMEPTIVSPADPVKIVDRIQGRIEYKQVCFSYPNRPDKCVIDDVSIDIEPGQNVAFVGHSGAGKSTMLQLLLRFYEANSGSICIDGVPLNQLSLDDLRGSISFVPQEVVVFLEPFMKISFMVFRKRSRSRSTKQGSWLWWMSLLVNSRMVMIPLLEKEGLGSRVVSANA